jgi:hypothetical protein
VVVLLVDLMVGQDLINLHHPLYFQPNYLYSSQVVLVVVQMLVVLVVMVVMVVLVVVEVVEVPVSLVGEVEEVVMV